MLIRFKECERRDKNDGKYQKTINYMYVIILFSTLNGEFIRIMELLLTEIDDKKKIEYFY